jgi:hypothetical protein
MPLKPSKIHRVDIFDPPKTIRLKRAIDAVYGHLAFTLPAGDDPSKGIPGNPSQQPEYPRKVSRMPIPTARPARPARRRWKSGRTERRKGRSSIWQCRTGEHTGGLTAKPSPLQPAMWGQCRRGELCSPASVSNRNITVCLTFHIHIKEVV